MFNKTSEFWSRITMKQKSLLIVLFLCCFFFLSGGLLLFLMTPDLKQPLFDGQFGYSIWPILMLGLVLGFSLLLFDKKNKKRNTETDNSQDA